MEFHLSNRRRRQAVCAPLDDPSATLVYLILAALNSSGNFLQGELPQWDGMLRIVCFSSLLRHFASARANKAPSKSLPWFTKAFQLCSRGTSFYIPRGVSRRGPLAGRGCLHHVVDHPAGSALVWDYD